MNEKLDKQSCYTVSKKTIAITQRCNKGFSCLKKQREDLCPIDYCLKGEIYIVKCLHEGSCSYQGTLGDGVTCYCPTRKELYDKHGV